MSLDELDWSGRLGDVEFLQRIFDLKSMKSFDGRFKDAAGDIWQHRENNFDWPNDWIFGDSRFNLLGCSAKIFLRFLCETVHPVVRPDRQQARKLVREFNDQLKLAGWILVEQEKIAGRPRFVAVASSARSVSVLRVKTVAEALDAAWMQKDIQRLENCIDVDPALAIGTAKDLVESCCKSILTARSVAFSSSADLPELTKLLTKELRLVPDAVSNEARGVETIRLILRNLSSLTKYLAELRSLYGTGHGRDGSYRGLQSRHARLAAAAAIAFIDFVSETHRLRSEQSKGNQE
jgi:hypothetical protein